MRTRLQNLGAGFSSGDFSQVNADHFHNYNTLVITALSADREPPKGHAFAAANRAGEKLCCQVEGALPLSKNALTKRLPRVLA